MSNPLQLTPPLVRLQNGVPWSLEYSDSYWSKSQGDPCLEAQTVFIDANRLAERWRQMTPGSAFHIAEIGFGTGLNFLCVWRLWRQLRPYGCRLNYLGLDLEPPPGNLQQIHKHRASIDKLSDTLTDAGLPVTGGVHRLVLRADAIRLTLAIGDAEKTLQDLLAGDGFTVDCWFMDGFAPAKNPSAWSAGLCRQMAAASHSGTTLSSYSAAGSVRRNLQASGFDVRRLSGYGGKRHRIEAAFAGRPEGSAAVAPARLSEMPKVLIVGDGIAGSSCARAMLDRGASVCVLADSGLGAASENPAALLRPRIGTGGRRDRLHWNLSGWQFSLRVLDAMARKGFAGWYRTGVLQYLPTAKSRRRAERLLACRPVDDLWRGMDSRQAGELAGLNSDCTGDGGLAWLHYPEAGWALMPEICKQWHSDCLNISARVCRLRYLDGSWQALGPTGKILATADICIVATGRSTVRIEGVPIAPDLKGTKGQMDRLLACPATVPLRMPLCGLGTLFPADPEGRHWAGAGRIVEASDSPKESASQTEYNRKRAEALVSRICEGPIQLTAEGSGWVANRWRSSDGLPVAGPCTLSPGLHFCLGMQSRGLIFAPLAGELIASRVFSEPPPLDGVSALAAAV